MNACSYGAATRVTTTAALRVIRRVFPEVAAAGIAVRQRFDSPIGWRDCTPALPLAAVGLLHAQGVEAVNLTFVDRDGVPRCPDYRLEEFAVPFVWEVGDRLRVHVNQGRRPAVVLAVLGDEALIEYEMPGGTTALWVIDARNPRPGCRRNVTYRLCPKRWRDAMVAAGTEWVGEGQ